MTTITWTPRNTRSDSNDIPLWGVTWDRTDKNARTLGGRQRRTGNSWTDQRIAERIFRQREADGLNPQAFVSYCAGFVEGLR